MQDFFVFNIIIPFGKNLKSESLSLIGLLKDHLKK
jgi:hypothetical protein